MSDGQPYCEMLQIFRFLDKILQEGLTELQLFLCSRILMFYIVTIFRYYVFVYSVHLLSSGADT